MTAPMGPHKGNENVIDETDAVEATGGIFDSFAVYPLDVQPAQGSPTDAGRVIDETSLPAPQAGLTSNVRREAPLAHQRESVRGGIAYMLAGALVGVVAIGAVGWLVIRAPLQDWTTFTSPLFTLVATMVGYYYGRRDS